MKYYFLFVGERYRDPLETKGLMKEKPLILIVDDEKSIRLLLSKFLKNKGFRIQMAEDGLDGLSAVSESLPDLIITDFKMPKLNGIEFLAKIWETYPDLPVIFVSAYFQFPEDLSDIHQGKTSFCPKPIILDDLMEKIHGHLDLDESFSFDGAKLANGDLDKADVIVGHDDEG